MSSVTLEQCQKLYNDGQFDDCLYSLTIYCESIKDFPSLEKDYLKSLSLYQQCYLAVEVDIERYSDLVNANNSFALNLFGNKTTDATIEKYFYKKSMSLRNPFACYNSYVRENNTELKKQYLSEAIKYKCHLAYIEIITNNYAIDLDLALRYYNDLINYYTSNSFVLTALKEKLGENNLVKLQLYKKMTEISNLPNIDPQIKKEIQDEYCIVTHEETDIKPNEKKLI